MHYLGKKRNYFLKISNVEELLYVYHDFEYYKNPYAIMAELEKEIEFKNKAEKHITIPYKEEGDCCFELIKKENKILTYEFMFFVS